MYRSGGLLAAPLEHTLEHRRVDNNVTRLASQWADQIARNVRWIEERDCRRPSKTGTVHVQCDTMFHMPSKVI